jgi:hypothetical protein
MTVYCFAAGWLIFELFSLVANGLFMGLINDVVPRTVIGRFFGLFRIFSLLAGIIFNFWLIKHAEVWGSWIFTGLGIIYFLGFLVMCLGVREGAYPPPEGQGVHPLRHFGNAMRQSFETPYYLAIFALVTVGLNAFQPVNVFDLKAAKEFGMPDAFYGVCVGISYIVSIAIAFPLGWWTDRFHPLRTAMVTMAIYGVGMLVAHVMLAPGSGAAVVVAHSPTSTALADGSATAASASAAAVSAGFWDIGPQGRVFAVVLILHTILSGTYFTTSASLAQRLFPRLTFAQLAAAMGIISGVGAVIASFGFPELIKSLGGSYRSIFLVGAGMAALWVLCWIPVFRGYLRLGGDAAYRAPGETET